MITTVVVKEIRTIHGKTLHMWHDRMRNEDLKDLWAKSKTK